MVNENAAADALLAGPRGRRLCLDFVNFMGGPGSNGSDPFAEALFWGAHERDVGSSTTVRFAILSSDDGASDSEDSIPSAPPVEEIARILEAYSLTAPTEGALAECLGAAVDSARYWQEPDGYDVLAAEPALRPQLLRIARAIADSAPAAWWSDAVEPANQWVVAFDGGSDAPATSARQALEDWRDAADREESDWRSYPTGPGMLTSGSWWSTPPTLLMRTTGSRGKHGPMGLRFVEDGLGWLAANVRPVTIAGTANLFEITSAHDWADLCRRYPRDVTASRRPDWGRATGWYGAWVIPDWPRIADDYDAVHLTVAGYLNAAGWAIPVDDERASVLAGWNPDEAVWLRDGAADPGRASQAWTCDDAGSGTWSDTVPTDYAITIVVG